jgi:hypothetical protein
VAADILLLLSMILAEKLGYIFLSKNQKLVMQFQDIQGICRKTKWLQNQSINNR